MGIMSSSPALKTPKGSSATQGTAVGTGARPKKSMYPIKSTSPENPQTMGRSVKGALK